MAQQRHVLPFRGGSALPVPAQPFAAPPPSSLQRRGPALALLGTAVVAAVLVATTRGTGGGGGGGAVAHVTDAAAGAAEVADALPPPHPTSVLAFGERSAEEVRHINSMTEHVGSLSTALDRLLHAHDEGVNGLQSKFTVFESRLTALGKAATDSVEAAAAAAAAAVAVRCGASTGASTAAAAAAAVAGSAPTGGAGMTALAAIRWGKPETAAGSELVSGGGVGGGGGGDGAAAPRGCIVGSYDSDFEHVTRLLRDVDGPGLAFVRYADGELGVAQGREIGNEEWRFAPGGAASTMQQDLLASLRGHYGQRYWYAFASPLDDAAGLRWYLERTEQSCGYISYANMWVNAHYPRTVALLKELTAAYHGRVLLVVNAESVAKVRADGQLGGDGWAGGALALADNLVTQWEQSEVRAGVQAQAEALARSQSGTLVMVSGGPVGKVITGWMWAANPTNKYVDFGSTLDPFLRGKSTRAYHNPGHSHAAQVDPDWILDREGRPVSL